jgi:tetratricopeptide (TPR) repeat protein
MPSSHRFLRSLFVAIAFVSSASIAAAQAGRLTGEVKDDSGAPVKDATVIAENPNASPGRLTTTTDSKGRFAILGLRSGSWSFTVAAAGYTPKTGSFQFSALKGFFLTVAIQKGGKNAIFAVSSKELEGMLSKADAMFEAKQYDQALVAYKAILEKVPTLSSVNIPIAQVYRALKDNDSAMAAYKTVLEADPDNDRAKAGLGQIYLEKGDFKNAEEPLAQAANSPAAGKEDFCNYAGLKFAQGDADAAQQWYQKAIDADPTYVPPVYQLAMVALNKGDKAGCATWLNKVIAMAPNSPEAAQAQALLPQLK